MPTARNLSSLEIDFGGGFAPSLPVLAPGARQNTIQAASNIWSRPDGIAVADGLLQVSATNVGARIFAADIQRASIAGGLVSSRLPYAGLLRYQNAVLFFLSENTSAQVYLNETAATGVTTSATAGRLRVAVPDGSGGYDTYDAGFDKPQIPSNFVQFFDSGAIGLTSIKRMQGMTGAAICAWRTSTNAISPPSETYYDSMTAGGNDMIRLRLNLISPVSGQDGWIFCGSRVGDLSGELQVVRYVYIQARGTFTATNSSDLLTAGVGTFWDLDLRPADVVTIDGGSYTIEAVTSNTTATLTSNFTGTTGSGKTMTMSDVTAEWYDKELGEVIQREARRPPRAAGVLQYAGRVFVWGCAGESDSSVTGPALFAMLKNNPEHIGLFAIISASGSDIVNVLGADGPMYIMTTTSLEAVSFTGDPDTPYIIRIIAEPGFKATTNACLYRDFFYGFNDRPLRTRADDNIDVQFARDVWSEMEGWDAQRVMVAVDPENEAVLYIYDDGSTTTVIPFMAQMGVWSAPLNFSARILDTQVVNGVLYVTYLSGGNIRVNQWEGGTGIGGTRYVASQFYDTNALMRNRIKGLLVTGKAGTLYVFAATPGAAVPDVTDTGQAVASFPLSDTDITEPEIFTNIHARAAAIRVDFASNDGRLESVIARGTPISQRV
jgi:hypothetical protein